MYACSPSTITGLVANDSCWTGGNQKNCACCSIASPPLLCLVVFVLCLRLGLSQGDDVFPIPGTKRIKYLEQNAAAFYIKLTAEEKIQLEAVFASDQVRLLVNISPVCSDYPVHLQPLANCKLTVTAHEHQLFMIYCINQLCPF